MSRDEDLTPAAAEMARKVRAMMRGFVWPEVGGKVFLIDGPCAGITVTYKGGICIEISALEQWGVYVCRYGLDGFYWSTKKQAA